MPTATRNLTSMIIRINDMHVLVDCGEGTQIQLRKAGESLAAIDAICLTHLHADHVLGLPGLLLSMDRFGRTEPVLLIGPTGTRKLYETILLFVKHLTFKVNILELNVTAETVMEFGFLKVTAFPLVHSVICYGYHFELTHAGKLNTEVAERIGVPHQAWEALQKGYVIRHNGRFVRRQDVCGENRKSINVVYITDTSPCPAIVEHSKDADLLILECMYGLENKDDEQISQDKMHLTIENVKAILEDAKPELTWLTHHSPSFAHVKKEVQEIFKGFNVDCEPFSCIGNPVAINKPTQTINKVHFQYKE